MSDPIKSYFSSQSIPFDTATEGTDQQPAVNQSPGIITVITPHGY